MGNRKRIGTLLLGVILAVSLLAPGSALAAFVSSGDGSVHLMVNFHPNNTNPSTPEGKIETQGFRLYHIADVNAAGDGFVLRENPDGTGYGELVGTSIATTYTPYNFYSKVTGDDVLRVSAYINAHPSIQPDYAAPLVEGKAEFSNLPAGVYLGVGPQSVIGKVTYTATPFLICLPYQTEMGGLIYTELSVTVKFTQSSSHHPSTPPDDPPDNPPEDLPDDSLIDIPDDTVPLVDFPPEDPIPTVVIPDEGVPLIELPDEAVPLSASHLMLPQTGQLWWPVPLFAIAGLVLVVLGQCGRRRSE